MIVTKIRISNILGIDQLEITPGKFNEITGKNGVGKTSVLEAIKGALKGGHDASLLRNGAEQGEIVLLFDNGDEIRKTVTETKSDLKVKQNGVSAKKPTSILDDLRDIVSVNPVEFIHAEKKRRLEILLEALTFDITDEQLSTAAGFPCRLIGNPLDCLGTIRKGVYDERTGLNRAEKEKRATLNQLSESIPANDVEDVSAEMAKLDTENRDNTSMYQAKLANISDRAEDQVDELREQIGNILKRAAQEKDEATAVFDAQTKPIIERRAALVEIAKTKAAFEQQSKIIEQMESEVEQLITDIEEKNDALVRLDALKESLLTNLPFKGLTIQEGEVYLGGVAFDRVNSSDQVRFVLQLAALRAGEMKLVCVDGLEMIDPERYTRFVEVAQSMDLQYFVTRVTNGDFKIATPEMEVL